jgi:hypothetical protein
MASNAWTLDFIEDFFPRQNERIRDTRAFASSDLVFPSTLSDDIVISAEKTRFI